MEVKLRPLCRKDAPFMLEWMADPEITCFFRFDASSVSLETCEEYIERAAKAENAAHFAIVDANDEYLGTISLKDVDRERGCAEYAISTRKRAHGTGAAMQATKMLLEYAFDTLGLEKVYLNVLADNGRANAFYRKAGFRFVREEAGAVEIRGEMKTLNWYEICPCEKENE
ncbi:MAG: GNAT family N-acetyltransferase [Clostridia bacterium]|nr:GNAT family N-acetyltransferase [Clostridia bacterium]